MRVGVVGMGRRAELARHVTQPGVAQVVSCAELSEPGRRRARQMFGHAVTLYPDYREMLAEDLDAVFVLVADNLGIASDFLRAGVPVFLVKPPAPACDRLLSTARETRTRLYAGHSLRHLPVVRKVRELIDQGLIGPVKSVWCRHFIGSSQPHHAHDLDVIHWLGGGRSRRVVALGGPDDTMITLTRLDNGVLTSYQQCQFTPDYWRNYTIIGTEGRLENFGDVHGATIKVWNRRRSGYRADADLTVTLAANYDTTDGSDRAVVCEFLRFAREGGKVETSPVSVRHAVAAEAAAKASLRSGGMPVDVPPLDPALEAWFADGQR